MNTATSTTPAEDLWAPPHKVLDEFMRNCSQDSDTRSAMATALIISFWQLASREISSHLPSIILINAGNKEHDPLIDCLRKIEENTKDHEPKDEDAEIGQNLFAGGTPRQAPGSMVHAANYIREYRALYQTSPVEDWEGGYHDARVTGYGEGRSSKYSQAWHPELGLITDKKDTIILRIDQSDDKEAFLHDLQDQPKKLRHPVGMGENFNFVKKTIAVSGAITPDQFDEQLVDVALKLSQPIFFLPHLTDEEIHIPNSPALNRLRIKLELDIDIAPLIDFPLPDSDWTRQIQDEIWKRLSHLPSSYRFPIIFTIHQLYCVCKTLALYAGEDSVDSEQEIKELYTNIFITVLRSLSISLAFLAWHGLGFDLGHHLSKARKLLKQLREKDSMTLRDTQRIGGFKNAIERDKLIQQLVSEGLVHQEGKTITAVALEAFIKNLQNSIPTANPA